MTTFEMPVEVEDLDVDVADETDDVSDEVDTDEKPAKAPKEKKAPARPPVPDGKVTPVQFAKILTEHLEAKGASNKGGLITLESNPIPPQMIYSYIRNNTGKNPLPTYSEGGRDNLLIVEEALAWWDAKDERIAAGKVAKAEKASKKAEKASKDTESGADAADESDVEEAE